MESLAWEHHLLMGWLSIAMFDYQGYICIICNRRDDIGTSFSRFIRVYEVHIAMTLPRIKMCTVYIYIYKATGKSFVPMTVCTCLRLVTCLLHKPQPDSGFNDKYTKPSTLPSSCTACLAVASSIWACSNLPSLHQFDCTIPEIFSGLTGV